MAPESDRVLGPIRRAPAHPPPGSTVVPLGTGPKRFIEVATRRRENSMPPRDVGSRFVIGRSVHRVTKAAIRVRRLLGHGRTCRQVVAVCG
ncbi:MAG: hypothetical protein U5N21_17050 [Rhodococcus sp. (in: high G+C Gram-positive bacteria)]|nr:hypothetical protein [Rhodococcus sp. (in: high G+C Gram-positive bacteria)]